MWLIGWGNTTWDADYTFTHMFRTNQILANYWNPEFNNLLEDGQTNMDQKKRLQIYSKASQILHRGRARHLPVPADRQLRGEPEGPVDGPARRADRRVQHGGEAVTSAFGRQRSAFSRTTEGLRVCRAVRNRAGR